MYSISERIKNLKVIPVVKLDSPSDAKGVGDALCRGGLPVAEVTFRTEAAEESIQIMRREFPDMLVGAGTVVNAEQARRAEAAGASFLVSPGMNRAVVEYAIDHQIPIFPGVCTPTEIMMALEYDLPVVKFFPAQQYGGLKTIKALAAVFPSLKFMPTGGIHAENVCEYLAFDKIIACGGSWMVKDTLIQNGNFAEIAAVTAQAVALVRE